MKSIAITTAILIAVIPLAYTELAQKTFAQVDCSTNPSDPSCQPAPGSNIPTGCSPTSTDPSCQTGPIPPNSDGSCPAGTGMASLKSFCCPHGDAGIHNHCNTMANKQAQEAEAMGALCNVITATGAVFTGHWVLGQAQNMVCQ